MQRIRPTEYRFMERALELARIAAQHRETPVGAVVVVGDAIVGEGYNLVETEQDATAHAEIVALRAASRTAADWRLSEAAVYVTVEPCIMCAAALLHARVGRVVYGAHDHRWGGFGSLFDLAHDPRINHDVEVIPGIMEGEAAELLTSFFRSVRADNAR